MAAQKVKGLSTYCEIKDISINQQEATIKVLMFSNQENNITFGLQFYLKDLTLNTEELIDNNNYWVEKFEPAPGISTNTEGNIDINLFKEIIFKIDITNNNRATFLIDRWSRDVCILIRVAYIVGITPIEVGEVLYTSEKLSLVSGLVIVPEIKQISIKSINTDTDQDVEKLLISIYYDYGIENDFNYNNNNVEYHFKLINPKTYRTIKNSLKILTENGTYDESSKLGVLKYTFDGLALRTPIMVNISIRDKKGSLIKNYNRLYIPSIPKNRVYVKYNGAIKEVSMIFTNFQDGKNADIDRLYLNNGTVHVYNEPE